MERTDNAGASTENQTGDSRQGRSSKGPRYFIVNDTAEAEAAFNAQLASLRNVEKPSGPFASIAQIMKASLGAGILSSHVAFMAGGLIPSLVLSVILGVFIIYSLYLVGLCAKICCRRTGVHTLSYPDVAEATFAISKFKCLRNISRYVRFIIDITICIELYGACACYQLMVSFSLKQLVENTQETSLTGLPGYPNLRIYLLIMMIPFICICLIRHLKWLAPVSLAGNLFVLVCVIATIYYSVKENPTFEGMTMYTSVTGALTFIGMTAFSMSCVGVVVPVENHLKNPDQFKMVSITGFTTVCICVAMSGLFGYNAYKEKSLTPITLNFPMRFFPKALKVVIALNLYFTHGINFWIPFNLTYTYLKKLHKPEKIVTMEYVYRTCICILISLIAIGFPDVPKVMSFIGCFCICIAAFIFPNLLYVLLIWERPGLGIFKWKLIRAIVFIVFGLVIFVAGSIVALIDLASLFYQEVQIERSTGGYYSNFNYESRGLDRHDL